MIDAARDSDAAQMLLAAFEKISGRKPSVADHVEAAHLTQLRVSPKAMVARMHAVALRNGPEWKPSSMRYFEAPLKDLERNESRPALSVLKDDPPSDQDTLTPDEHRRAMAELRRLMTDEQKRRADLVCELQPRASGRELMALLHERIDEREFARRLDAARASRGRA